MRLAAPVFVVAKNTRSLLSIASKPAFRAGFAIAGAKAHSYCGTFGTTSSRALIQSKSTKAKSFFVEDHTLSIQKM
jgi:hypothetical protein